MINIFISACSTFSDYRTLEKLCNKILSNIDKNEINFFCTFGKSGDNTCSKYVKDNSFRMTNWLPSRKGKTIKEERKKTLTKCDYAIIVMDEYHRGMITATKQSAKYVKKSFVVVVTSDRTIQKFNNDSQTANAYTYDTNFNIFKIS